MIRKLAICTFAAGVAMLYYASTGSLVRAAIGAVLIVAALTVVSQGGSHAE